MVSVLIGEVTRVDFSECPDRVWVGDDEYRADALVVVTGASFTRGREAVEMYLDDDDPPLAMIVSTNFDTAPLVGSSGERPASPTNKECGPAR